MNKVLTQKLLFCLLFWSIFLPISYAGEIDSILSGFAFWIILFLSMFALTMMMVIFMIFKDGRKKFIVFSMVNLIILLLIYFTLGPKEEFLLLEKSFLLKFIIVFQMIVSVVMIPKHFLNGNSKEEISQEK